MESRLALFSPLLCSVENLVVPFGFTIHMMLKILPVLLVIGLMLYGWYRNDLRRLTRDYACEQPFDGPLQHCVVRFPLDETGTDCVLGANRDGLYMSSSRDALKRNRRWSFRYYVIRTPIFIPWNCLQVAKAKFPMRAHLRFQVPSNKATFFVPQETGRLLLQTAGPRMSHG
jgi:hypothetical protein